jgi:repressor LexA
MALTKRQREMLDFIEGFVRFRGYSPSFEEIAENFGYRSLATVHEHLSNLQSKGYITRNYNESRSIDLVEAEIAVSAVELPLRGTVAAGHPIEAIEDRETLGVPEDMIAGSTAEHYVLRVRGSSMIDEQIRDGDYVIVQSREIAHNGEMVIALIDGENATMKKLYKEDGQIRLQPANQALDPMYFDADRVTIQGVVIGVIRRY